MSRSAGRILAAVPPVSRWRTPRRSGSRHRATSSRSTRTRRDEALTNSFKNNIYEGLVRYNEKFETEPALAVSWKNVDPVDLAVVLRKGVTFHDGTPFSADDVVFSLARQKSKTSGRASHVSVDQERPKD